MSVEVEYAYEPLPLNPELDLEGSRALMDLDVSRFLDKLLKDNITILKKDKDITLKTKNQIRKLKRLLPIEEVEEGYDLDEAEVE
jgi:hypothetical protein